MMGWSVMQSDVGHTREEVIVEPGDSWVWNESWTGRAKELIETGKRSDGSEWSAERRERILQQVLAKVERARERGRLLQAFAAGASTVLLVGLLLRLVGVGGPAQVCKPELVGTTAVQRLAAAETR
jgi:hypothetical protein